MLASPPVYFFHALPRNSRVGDMLGAHTQKQQTEQNC